MTRKDLTFTDLPRLTDIEQRAQKATSGPWEQEPFTNALVTIGGDLAVAEDVYTQEDREFIAHSRQDVPALTAAIRTVLELTPPGVSPLSCYGGAPDDMPDETAFWDEGRWALAKEIREAIAKHLDT